MWYSHTMENYSAIKKGMLGLPRWSSGWDSVLPLEGARVRSLVGEVPHAARGDQKKRKKKLQTRFKKKKKKGMLNIL